MSADTEWFNGSQERKPRLIIPVVIWAVVICALIGGAAMLSGCATDFKGVCALKVVGQDEHGNIIARTYCEAQP
jgi:hypothetical protein